MSTASAEGFDATYRYNPSDGEEGFSVARRIVVFQDDFTRDPNARRLLVEGFCVSYEICAVATEIARSVQFR